MRNVGIVYSESSTTVPMQRGAGFMGGVGVMLRVVRQKGAGAGWNYS